MADAQSTDSSARNPRSLTGPDNPNWRGGRLVASNGYVLVRVGVDHHLADVRGYAYEHRIVAEQKIGRRLKPGELIHHVNGNKEDNRPENLEVCADNAEHFLHHRKEGGKALRMPGEENPDVQCECGCGATFAKYDDAGRPRRFIPGHNPPKSPTIDAIKAALASGPKSGRQIAVERHIPAGCIKSCLSKLKMRGVVGTISRGVYFWKGNNDGN